MKRQTDCEGCPACLEIVHRGSCGCYIHGGCECPDDSYGDYCPDCGAEYYRGYCEC